MEPAVGPKTANHAKGRHPATRGKLAPYGGLGVVCRSAETQP